LNFISRESVMPHGDHPQGIHVPGFWQWVAILAVAALVAQVWIEFRDQRKMSRLIESPGNAVERAQRVELLVRHGRGAVPRFIREASSPDLRVRRDAVLGLGRIGPEAADALGSICERLNDADPLVRAYAVNAVWNIQPQSENAIQILASKLSDDNHEVRFAASSRLETIAAKSARPVIEQLHSERATARLAALQALLRIDVNRTDAEIADALPRLWSEPDPDTRAKAVYATMERRSLSVAQIRELLRDPNRGVEELGLLAVARLGPRASELLPDLVDLLEHERKPEPDRIVTIGAWEWASALGRGNRFPHESLVRAIGALGPEAGPAIPSLLRYFDQAPPPDRIIVSRALINAGVCSEEIVPRLVALLSEQTRGGVCCEAGQLLVRVSPDEARRQIALLLPQLAGEQTGSLSVLEALYGMGAEAREFVPEFLQLLSRPVHAGWTTQYIVLTLGEIGPEAAPAVPTLVRMLDNGKDRETVIKTLGKIGPAAIPALPFVLRTIGAASSSAADEVERSRLAAVAAVGRVGGNDPDVLAILRSLVHNESPPLRTAAIDSLGFCRSEAALRDLLSLLDDPAPDTRLHAAQAIGNLRADRRTAVAPLTSALHDKDWYVQTAAAIALGRIGGPAIAAVPALERLADESANLASNQWRRQLADAYQFGAPPSLQYLPELDELFVDEVAQTAISRIQSVLEESAEPAVDSVPVDDGRD
jgi:HEAT repeat protein